MPAPPRFSFSRATTFEQCARRYRYRYLDGVKEGFRSVEAFMGQVVHATIEWLYNELARGNRPDAELAVADYCDRWDTEMGSSRTPVKVIKSGTEMESYRRLGADLLQSFYRARFANDELRTVAMERHFSTKLDDRHAFQGYIDRLALDADGLLHIIDYKTGRRVPQRFEGKDAQQLEAYAAAMFRERDDEEICLVLEYLSTGKQLTKRIGRDEAARGEARLASRIDVALEATVFPPITGPLCDWCGFNDICDAYPGRRRGRR